MSISSVTSKVIYVGSGSTAAAAKIFAYPFKIFAATDLVVSEYAIVQSSATVKTLNTDYTVSGVGSDSGGNVTLTGSYTNLSTASQLIIQRTMPLTQAVDYVENDPFPAETHEKAIDKLCMIDQQLQEQLDRCIKADIAQMSSNTSYVDVINQATIAATSSATVAVAQVAASTSSAVVSVAAANSAVTQAGNAAVYAAQASTSAATLSSGVTTALDNLANVAINTSLLPGSSNYINLGSATKSWANVYVWNTGHITTVKSNMVSTSNLNIGIATINTGNITTVVSTLLSSGTLDVGGTGNITTVRATMVSSSQARVSGTANINTIQGLATPLTTGQGGTGSSTASNTAGGVVVLDAYEQLPAVDGSLLTGLGTVWTDYFATSTIVGWSSKTGYIYTKKIGKTVFVQYQISGTSNSTSTTFTVPYAGNANVGMSLGYAVDNGGTAVAGYITLPGGDSIVTLYSTVASGAWTASGTKNVQGAFCYETA